MASHFTHKDRNMLIETNTTVKLIKEAHEKRLENLEEEDKTIHGRITEGHKEISNRIGRIKFISAATTGVGGAIGAAFAYLKLAITQGD